MNEKNRSNSNCQCVKTNQDQIVMMKTPTELSSRASLSFLVERGREQSARGGMVEQFVFATFNLKVIAFLHAILKKYYGEV